MDRRAGHFAKPRQLWRWIEGRALGRVQVPGVGHALDDEALADVGDVPRDAVGGTQAPGPLLGSVCGGEHGLDAWAILGEHVVCDSQALHGNPLKSGVGGGRGPAVVTR